MEISRYLEDSSGYRGEAERVFIPSSEAEVGEIAAKAAAGKIPLTVAGAGTGLTGARVPHGGWVISLERFREIEIGRGRARCGAGALLKDLQQAAAQTRQFFGPNPTENSASVGGIVGTNAGGARSFHYGSVRRHVLALHVTRMDGSAARVERGEGVDFVFRPAHQPGTTKNSAGYCLQPGLQWVDLLAGSEGTLGITTSAELQLIPEPGAVLSGIIFFGSDVDAFEAVEAWRDIPELRQLEFMDEHSLGLLRPSYGDIPADARAALFIEQNVKSEDDGEVDAWAERLGEQGAFADESWFGFTAADRERFRVFRHTLAAMVTDTARRNGYPKFSTDFAVPLGRNRDLHEYYKQRCGELFPRQYTIFGHVGDANNHINLFPASGEEARRVEELMGEFARYVVSSGGTVAAEHGIGKSKRDLLKLMYSPDEIEAMREVKRQMDPDWLLGRGTIFEA
ncbi:MAG: FAD-binding oxidoreductase [Acidobacteriaceae bacterium]|nr:FAD-binding oxidoreductase [Acidobacteriaceae bacterium]